MPIKSIDDVPRERTSSNEGNPNPYLRRFGSHVKSHFSKSNCEIFGSDEDENTSKALAIQGNPGSMSSMGSMVVRTEFNAPGNNSSLHNLDREHHLVPGKSMYGGRSAYHLKNNASLGGNNDPTVEQFENGNTCSGKIDIETNDILSPNLNDSVESLNSVDMGLETLAEPGTENVVQKTEVISGDENRIEEENNLDYLSGMCVEKMGEDGVDTAENSFHLSKKQECAEEEEEEERGVPLELEEG